MGWAQQGQFTALINHCLTVILEYINLLAGYSQIWLSLLLATPLKQGTQLIFKVYLRDHVHQLEYSKQHSMIETYYRCIFTSAHYPFSLMKQTSSKLVPKIIYGQVHVGFTIDNTVSMVTYPIRRNKLLKMHDRWSQK